MKIRLIEEFKKYSIDTWNRVQFSRAIENLKTYEVTLTQNLVYHYFLLSREFELPIKIYEAENETINGNDIEFAIETKQGYVLLPMQAKTIKKDDKYSTINHIVKGKYQIDLLEKYARKVNGIPLYLFYNTLNEPYRLDENFIQSLDDELELYGCSICKKEDLERFRKKHKWEMPKFSDIHPKYGIPLHHLIEVIGKDLQTCRIFNQSDLIEYGVKFYGKEEVIESFKGKNLSPPPSIGYIPNPKAEEGKEVENLSIEYAPRYRVIISSDLNFNRPSIRIIG